MLCSLYKSSLYYWSLYYWIVVVMRSDDTVWRSECTKRKKFLKEEIFATLILYGGLRIL